MNRDWIQPGWPAPLGIRAVCTTRAGGCSEGPFRSMNLGLSCGDDPMAVKRNRATLDTSLPGPPAWLRQVHGSRVVRHGEAVSAEPEADAIVAFHPGEVCGILTADCLPVLFCSRSGDRVAAAHAGWRGLAAGILPATVAALDEAPARLLAWLGPAIGPRAYEVGQDVLDAFPSIFDPAFRPSGDRWMLDLYALARRQLEGLGVAAVYGGAFCTHSQADRFFSYRRDGQTGRMATLVWRE